MGRWSKHNFAKVLATQYWASVVCGGRGGGGVTICKVVQDPLLAAAVAASKAGQELGVHILYAPFGKEESKKVVVEMRWAKGNIVLLENNL